MRQLVKGIHVSSLVAFALVLAGSFGIVRFANGQDSKSIEKTSTLGPITATVTFSPEKPTIGDTLELFLEVSAKQDVEVLMPEFGEALGRFQIIDFQPKESLNSDGSTRYTQTYRLQSPPSGDHAIPPIMIEFVDRREGEQQAPEGLDAYELLTDRINFTVESVLVDDAAAELNPPLGRIEPGEVKLEEPVSLWIYVVSGAGGLALVCCAWIAAAAFRRRVVRKSAYEIARRKLDDLLTGHENRNSNIDQFYVSLTAIVRQYLENRFDLRAPDLTTEEFLTTVADSAELSNDHKKLLNQFLKHADLVKFARLEPSTQDIDETVKKASTFLDETRENSPLIVVPHSLTKESGPVKEQVGRGDHDV